MADAIVLSSNSKDAYACIHIYDYDSSIYQAFQTEDTN